MTPQRKSVIDARLKELCEEVNQETLQDLPEEFPLLPQERSRSSDPIITRGAVNVDHEVPGQSCAKKQINTKIS